MELIDTANKIAITGILLICFDLTIYFFVGWVYEKNRKFNKIIEVFFWIGIIIFILGMLLKLWIPSVSSN